MARLSKSKAVWMWLIFSKLFACLYMVFSTYQLLSQNPLLLECFQKKFSHYSGPLTGRLRRQAFVVGGPA